MLAVHKGQVWEIYNPTVGYWDRAVVVDVENDRVTLRHQTSFQKTICLTGELEQRPERYRLLAKAQVH